MQPVTIPRVDPKRRADSRLYAFFLLEQPAAFWLHATSSSTCCIQEWCRDAQESRKGRGKDAGRGEEESIRT